jgi:hypothetical protein
LTGKGVIFNEGTGRAFGANLYPSSVVKNNQLLKTRAAPNEFLFYLAGYLKKGR